MTPHLVKWQEKYGARGFQVVEVDDGRSDSLAAVEKHATEHNLPYPVVHDTRGATCDKFGIRAFPSAYLIGRDGKVIWEGHPDGSEEPNIAAALAAG